jgi:hypothetical protein
LQVVVPTGSWVVQIEVRPLGGDSHKVTLDASKPSGLAGLACSEPPKPLAEE